MPDQNTTKDEVLMRGYCTIDEKCLAVDFVHYVRWGNEVIARTKRGGGLISYFNVSVR